MWRVDREAALPSAKPFNHGGHRGRVTGLVKTRSQSSIRSPYLQFSVVSVFSAPFRVSPLVAMHEIARLRHLDPP